MRVTLWKPGFPLEGALVPPGLWFGTFGEMPQQVSPAMLTVAFLAATSGSTNPGNQEDPAVLLRPWDIRSSSLRARGDLDVTFYLSPYFSPHAVAGLPFLI